VGIPSSGLCPSAADETGKWQQAQDAKQMEQYDELQKRLVDIKAAEKDHWEVLRGQMKQYQEEQAKQQQKLLEELAQKLEKGLH